MMRTQYGLFDILIHPIVFLMALWIFFQLGYKILNEDRLIGSPFLPSSGTVESLSPELIATQDWVKKHQISNFLVTEELDQSGFYKERIAELLYPIRSDKGSHWVFASPRFQAPTHCLLREKDYGVFLYECKP